MFTGFSFCFETCSKTKAVMTVRNFKFKLTGLQYIGNFTSKIVSVTFAFLILRDWVDGSSFEFEDDVVSVRSFVELLQVSVKGRLLNSIDHWKSLVLRPKAVSKPMELDYQNT